MKKMVFTARKDSGESFEVGGHGDIPCWSFRQVEKHVDVLNASEGLRP